jgi:hypothetical protein
MSTSLGVFKACLHLEDAHAELQMKGPLVHHQRA